MELIKTQSNDKRMLVLIKQLNAELRANYGEEQDTYDTFNVFETPIKTILLKTESEIVACGAFKELEGEKVEIKRMYVKQAFRRKGYSITILNALEQWAAELSYKQAILETGKQQKAAISLYLKQGYRAIACYPPYNKMPSSRCYAKQL